MDESKKRKHKRSSNGGEGEISSPNSEQQLRLLLDPLAKDQLVDLLAKLGTLNPTVAEEIRDVASSDPVHRKLFIRGLAWETTSETLCAEFSGHGEIVEGAVIVDKATGKSRGYGFITYKHMESAQRALRESSKLIDGRLAVCTLASESLSSTPVSSDIALRKIYIGGLSPDISSEVLLNFFGRHGEIEEGSVAYNKETTKSRGFGFVTYKTVEAAKKAIADPNKILGGRNITVKLADSKNKATQGQGQPTAPVVPIPIPVPAGYPRPGAASLTYAPYPETYASYPASYPSVSTQYPPYSHFSYATEKGTFRSPAATSAGYPYYLTKP